MAARPTKLAGMKPNTGEMEVYWTDGVWRKKGSVLVIELQPDDFDEFVCEPHVEPDQYDAPNGYVRLPTGLMSIEDIRR